MTAIVVFTLLSATTLIFAGHAWSYISRQFSH